MDLFAKLRDSLKAKHPTIAVSVRRCKMPKRLLGDCCRRADHFLIRVDASQPEQGQLDTLVHEFAHAVAFIEFEETAQHGPIWASAYADCYRIYEQIAT